MDINIIVESLPRLLKGALLTLELTGISLGLGLFLAIALPIALDAPGIRAVLPGWVKRI